MSGHLINCQSTVEDNRNTSCSISFSFLFSIYIWCTCCTSESFFIKLNMCGDKPNIKAAFSTKNFFPLSQKKPCSAHHPPPWSALYLHPARFCLVMFFIFCAYIHIHICNSGVVTHKCWIICNSACLWGNFYFAFKSVTRRCLRWEKRERTIAL